MLAKENRLSNRKDFQTVYQNGFFSSAGNVTIKSAKNNLPLTRIGFSVGKKISKKATVRNRLKRLLRQSASQHMPTISEGFDIIVMYRTTPEKDVLGDISLMLSQALKKSGLLKKE